MLQPVYLFTDAALTFLDRMAEELGLPMKKIEVCASADNENSVANPYAHVLNDWQIAVALYCHSPLFRFVLAELCRS